MPMPYYQPSPMQNTFMPYQSCSYQQPSQQYQYTPPVQVQTPNLNGRTVNNFNEITANDVPMNGGIAIFPKADLSEIEVRQWNANGTISTRSFKPTLIESGTNTQQSENNADLGQIEGLWQGIIDRLDNIEKLITPKTRKAEEKAQ